MKRENWKLEAADNFEWSVAVDIEDAAIDLNSWQQSGSSRNKAKAIALFSNSNATCLQMTEYIRSDALPGHYVFGIGLYVTPSENVTNGASVEVNKARFHALVDHLRL